MRKLILAMLAVALSITLSYAESCSSGQGSLSYQISGCGDQSRACCTGQWCSWGTTSCASCTATSTTNSRNCSGNVSGACAGTQTQSCTRSVTGSCGSSCSYSGWSCGGWSGSCTYTQSCTATSESRNCSGNVYWSTGGTQTRSRSVTNSCGSCTYGDWDDWTGGSCTCQVGYFYDPNQLTVQCIYKYKLTPSKVGDYGYSSYSDCQNGSSGFNYWKDKGCSKGHCITESSLSFPIDVTLPDSRYNCEHYPSLWNKEYGDTYVIYKCANTSKGWATGYLRMNCDYSDRYKKYLGI